MRTGRSRSFTLIDAMILIAAIAIGLKAGVAFYRFMLVRTMTQFGVSDPLFRTVAALNLIRHERARGTVTSAALFLACCTSGLLVLRLRRPHPPIRRVALRPGSAVLVAVLFSATFSGVIHLVRVWRGEGDLPSRVGDFIDYGSYHFARNTESCVVLIWAVLALGRRWRVRGWIEWSGLVLGASWILIFFADLFGVDWIAPF